MLQAHFGTDDPKALGITVKNIQRLSPSWTRAQPGIDAVLNVEPAAQGAVNSGELVNLLAQRSVQMTESSLLCRRPGRQGRRPQGREFRQDAVRAGGLLPASHLVGGARGIPAPESKGDCRTAARQCPGHQPGHADDAGRCRSSTSASFRTGSEDDRTAQRPYVENILYRRRGWSWITEGDARTLVGLSQVKSILPAIGPDRRSGEAADAPWSAPSAKEWWSTPAGQGDPGPGGVHRHKGDRHSRPAGVGNRSLDHGLIVQRAKQPRFECPYAPGQSQATFRLQATNR